MTDEQPSQSVAPATAGVGDTGAADRPFSYRAQTVDGRDFSGTIDADTGDGARRKLEGLGLRVLDVAPATTSRPGRLTGQDFVAFNQQLAELIRAGMPIGEGLRLISRDLGSHRVRNTVNRIADEVEAGKSLGDAFEAHRGAFPPLYARLMDAGVKTGRLPDLLADLGRYMEINQRLRNGLIRAMTYPLLLFVAVMVLLLFISIMIVPHFEQIFSDFDTELPGLTRLVLSMGAGFPTFFVVAMVILAAAIVGFVVARAVGATQRLADVFVLPLPIVGTVLKHGVVARWCAALRIGIEVGMPLHEALETAGQASHSPRMRRDSDVLAQRARDGAAMDDQTGRLLVPAMVCRAIDLSLKGSRLENTLHSLTEMHYDQAENRLENLTVALLPIMLVPVGIAVVGCAVALLLPLVNITTALT